MKPIHFTPSKRALSQEPPELLVEPNIFAADLLEQGGHRFGRPLGAILCPVPLRSMGWMGHTKEEPLPIEVKPQARIEKLLYDARNKSNAFD